MYSLVFFVGILPTKTKTGVWWYSAAIGIRLQPTIHETLDLQIWSAFLNPFDQNTKSKVFSRAIRRFGGRDASLSLGKISLQVPSWITMKTNIINCWPYIVRNYTCSCHLIHFGRVTAMILSQTQDTLCSRVQAPTTMTGLRQGHSSILRNVFPS